MPQFKSDECGLKCVRCVDKTTITSDIKDATIPRYVWHELHEYVFNTPGQRDLTLVPGRSIVGKLLLDSCSSNSICKFRKADSSTDLNTHVNIITTYNKCQMYYIC